MEDIQKEEALEVWQAARRPHLLGVRAQARVARHVEDELGPEVVSVRPRVVEEAEGACLWVAVRVVEELPVDCSRREPLAAYDAEDAGDHGDAPVASGYPDEARDDQLVHLGLVRRERRSAVVPCVIGAPRGAVRTVRVRALQVLEVLAHVLRRVGRGQKCRRLDRHLSWDIRRLALVEARDARPLELEYGCPCGVVEHVHVADRVLQGVLRQCRPAWRAPDRRLGDHATARLVVGHRESRRHLALLVCVEYDAR